MEEVIYKHETNGEFTGIYAQIEDGKLTITEQDMGEFEKEYSRDGEVESFVFFDVANTNRLMRSLHASDDYSLIESLKKKFKKHGSCMKARSAIIAMNMTSSIKHKYIIDRTM